MNFNSAFMRNLDLEYRDFSGLNERRYYSIFYSQIKPSKILLLGYNPGGDPANWDESALASPSFYENREHEYVDTNFPTSLGMRSYLLGSSLVKSVDEIRDIPKINLIFRRSRNMNELPISPRQALVEAQPFVEQIIETVCPELIICEGKSTLDKFEDLYCEKMEQEVDGRTVFTPNGRHNALIYRADRATVNCLGRSCLLVGIGHPSKYSSRGEWKYVLENTRNLLC
jgi:hypothetical protein